ncbi:MAG: 2-oxo acid dehydrogenase subunit E2 [bacterium]
MARVPIKIPPIGEGLVEAQIVRFLKQPGDPVSRDETLFEIETDKATLEIPSPVAGILGKWEAKEGDILPIESLVVTVISDSGDAVETVSNAPVSQAQTMQGKTAVNLPGVSLTPSVIDGDGPIRNSELSPRVRAYCRDHNIPLEETRSILRSNPDGRLQVSDIERWLSASSVQDFHDKPLSTRQKTMAYRLKRAAQQAVPASIELNCSWDPIEQTRSLIKQKSGGKFRPSGLDLICWVVVQAMNNHPKFRSAFIGDNAIREYAHVFIGVAVSLPDDELTTAVMPKADTYGFEDFVTHLQERIELARKGVDQLDVIQVSITNMAAQGIRSAVPVVVPPAVATLFIGAPYEEPRQGPNGAILWEKTARFVLNFDHRLINGVGGARFLREISDKIKALPKEFGK